MQHQRDKQIYALYGLAKYTGPITGPFFPSAVPLLKGGVGYEQSTTGTAGSKVGTLTSTVLAGVTSVSYTSTSGGAPVVNDIFQIGTSTTNAELRKVTAVSGTGPYTLTLDTATIYGHTSGVAMNNVSAPPYTHTLLPGLTTLDSLTVEKCIAGYQSIQYPGSRVNKLSFKSATGASPLEMTADMMTLLPSVLGTPSTPTFNYDTPFIFTEATITLLGTVINTITDLQIDIDNALKPTYTHVANHSPTFLTPVSVKAGGTMKLVFQSLNDSNVGYFSKALPPASGGAGTQGALVASWSHSNPAATITITFPQVNFSKYGDMLKLEEVAMIDLGFEASYNTTNGYAFQVQVANNQYLPY